VRFAEYVEGARSWAPVPTDDGRINLARWLLLEGNRYAVTGSLLTVAFVSVLAIGTLWTFEMQQLLTETQAVQMVLSGFLNGIILLVSVVVSINSIVLSHDINHIAAQENRIQGMMEFQRRVGQITGADVTPAKPNEFLESMAETIQLEANGLVAEAEGSDEAFAEEIRAYLEQITGTTDYLDDSINEIDGGRFSVLWLGLETDYGPMMNRSHQLTSRLEGELSEEGKEHLERLIEAMELFATGREYFKTLYYTLEISELSRTLLFVSLPAILMTASTILAIDGNLLPEIWVLGLPPLMSFVAFSIVVALAPFIVLTSYMLRVATVSRRTAGAGAFDFQS